jgi:hypothetical protein
MELVATLHFGNYTAHTCLYNMGRTELIHNTICRDDTNQVPTGQNVGGQSSFQVRSAVHLVHSPQLHFRVLGREHPTLTLSKKETDKSNRSQWKILDFLPGNLAIFSLKQSFHYIEA